MHTRSWKADLDQIFGAYVRQETLESGANEMAEISHSEPDMHEQFVLTLSMAVKAAGTGDEDICRSIERSGHFCADATEAEKICRELLMLYRSARP